MNTQRLYRGSRFGDVVEVSVYSLDHFPSARKVLTSRPDLGAYILQFEWGRQSSGTRQLAVAMLADALADDRKAVALAPLFAENVLARLSPNEPWMVSDNVLRATVAALAKEPVPA